MRKNLKEARQAAGLTQQQMADIKIDFDGADAMQERQRKTILVRGQEVPTYQFVFEQGIGLKRKINRIAVVVWVAILVTVINFLWR